jgi:hypothetical protein
MFAPPDHIEMLEENAVYNNVPRIGVSENVAFPAGQLNPTGAVSYEECEGEYF